MQNKRIEGYWNNTCNDYPEYPMPISSDAIWPKSYFLRKLKAIENKAKTTQYRGWSTCRLCGCKNGSKDFEYDGWVWPEGFYHYIDKHNVMPSKDFIKFIESIGI